MEIIHRLDEFRASIAHVRNRAVFEIPEILERIMESTPAHDPPRHGRDPRPGSGGSHQLTTFLLAFGALFSIVNPLSGAFIFFGATQGWTRRCAPRSRVVAIYAFCIVSVSLYVGAYVLSFFGISIPVLRVAGASSWRCPAGACSPSPTPPSSGAVKRPPTRAPSTCLRVGWRSTRSPCR